MHPEIDEIGYHCRDYFVKQWDRFSHVHWGVLAHSTHLRGAGPTTRRPARSGCGCRSRWRPAYPRTYAARRTWATWTRRPWTSAAFEADPDTLVVPNAGEVLFRLR